MQVPTYRLCTAMCVRPWFALELCQLTPLLDFLCTPASEAGAMSAWRFGVLRVLDASALAAATANGTATATQAALVEFSPRLQAAMWQGPYGVPAAADAAADGVPPQVALASRAV